ncbi:MAG: lamin tail domain-containing protein [Polyangiaceae bacterium]
MTNQHFIFVLGAASLLLACSEAASPSGGTGASGGSTSSGMGGAGMGGEQGTGASSSSTGGNGTGASGGGGGASIEGIVINEIAADDRDFVELYNTTGAAVSLDGVFVADDDGGVPKVAEKVDLAGQSIGPGGFLVVVGQGEVCTDFPAPCVEAGWGISHGNGDVIYLLDGSDSILVQQDYPADAAPVVGTDLRAWGRFPDGTGSFQIVVSSPGESNTLP